MTLTATHDWDLSLDEARRLQQQLASEVICDDRLPTVHTVAGTDVGFEDNGKTTRAAITVHSFPELTLLDYAVSRCPTRFPYVPGYLSFRECPALLQALEALRTTPDLVLCDGQGIAHPRRFGIACHFGVLTGLPTIGVAKSRLVGHYDAVGPDKGDWQPLFSGGGSDDIIGAVVRTRTGVKPLFISSGHRISLASAIHYTLACTTRYRLPETTRWADGIASQRPAFMRKLNTALQAPTPDRP